MMPSTKRIRRKQSILLAAAMIHDSVVSLATIRFFVKGYPLFLEQPTVTSREMAAKNGITGAGAKKHMDVLVEQKYLKRLNYRCWELNTDKITSMRSMSW